MVLFTDPAIADDRGDQNSRRGLKSDHTMWDDWLRIRERNQLDVAEILDWQVHPHEARCRADLTKANPASKCRRWNREFSGTRGSLYLTVNAMLWRTRKRALDGQSPLLTIPAKLVMDSAMTDSVSPFGAGLMNAGCR